jgi:hypothetical protein
MSSVIVSVVPNDLTICCAVISTRSSPSGAAILLLDPAALQKLQNSLVYLNINHPSLAKKQKKKKEDSKVHAHPEKHSSSGFHNSISSSSLFALPTHFIFTILFSKKNKIALQNCGGGGKQPSLLHLVLTALLGHSLSVAKLHQIARE